MGMYRKSYYCICEGQQESMYLKHIASLINDFPRKVVAFKCIEGDVLEMKVNYVEYDNVALFDHDLRKERFEKSIALCDKIMRDNAKKGKKKDAKKFYHAYSNLNFDLWMLLHKQNYSRMVSANDAYVADVRRAYGLVKDADIKDMKVIEAMLKQISLDDVKNAIGRAEKIRDAKLLEDGKKVGNSICYENPDLSIHEFLKCVLVDCGEM